MGERCGRCRAAATVRFGGALWCSRCALIRLGTWPAIAIEIEPELRAALNRSAAVPVR